MCMYCAIAEMSATVISSLSLPVQVSSTDYDTIARIGQYVSSIQSNCTTLTTITNTMDTYVKNDDPMIAYRAGMTKEIVRRFSISNNCK